MATGTLKPSHVRLRTSLNSITVASSKFTCERRASVNALHDKHRMLILHSCSCGGGVAHLQAWLSVPVPADEQQVHAEALLLGARAEVLLHVLDPLPAVPQPPQASQVNANASPNI
jgi:hypothetical protein